MCSALHFSFHCPEMPAMFKGESSVKFHTSDPTPKILESVEESLERLGKVSISNKGLITISPKDKFHSVLTDTTIEGKFEKGRKPNEYSVTLSYSCAPSVLNWAVMVIGTLSLCIGWVAIFETIMKKGVVSKELQAALSDLEGSFESSQALQ
jgi:hypothetical protein